MAKVKATRPHALSVRNAADILRLQIETQHARCAEPIPGGPGDADPRPWMRAMAQRTATFDKKVPNLIEIRDTQEHFDAYRSNIGHRQKAGEPASGFGYGLGATGGVVTYGQFKLNVGDAVLAAHELHRAIRDAVDADASQDPHGGPDTVLISQP